MDKDIWEMVSVTHGEQKKYLEEGWEPFAVTVANVGSVLIQDIRYRIWLRRRVKKA